MLENPEPRNLPSGDSFPIRQPDEHTITRREFSKLLGVASLLTVGVARSGAARRLLSTPEQPTAIAVAMLGEIPVRGYKLFRYPTEHDPCILIRQEPQRYVAFSQSCTHLKCPVYFQPGKSQLVCPCHEGYFSADDGRPLAGPPKAPLARLSIFIKDDQIWVS